MAAPSKKIQVVVDENVHGVLTKMGAAGLRGKSTSEVAYKILDEWIWHNQEKLVQNGISLKPNKVKRRT
ncbi:MAG: hypothetical protein ABSH11_02280 [Verrucomicrobiota bacterium]|jgi:hypothetical protein